MDPNLRRPTWPTKTYDMEFFFSRGTRAWNFSGSESETMLVGLVLLPI